MRLSHVDYRIVLDFFVDLIEPQLHHKMIDSIEDYPKREREKGRFHIKKENELDDLIVKSSM